MSWDCLYCRTTNEDNDRNCSNCAMFPPMTVGVEGSA